MEADKLLVFNAVKIVSKKMENPLYGVHTAYLSPFDGCWTVKTFFGPETLLKQFQGPGVYDYKMGPRDALLSMKKIAEVTLP